MSIFLETNHLFLRSPGGEVENALQMKAAGFGAIFCNIGDFEPSRWDLIRKNAKAAGIACGPWLRTADAQHEFVPQKLLYLCDVADEWGEPGICNSEKEIDHTGDDITPWITDTIGDRDFAISMEVRPFGDVDWRPLAKYPILPQNFPAETGLHDTDDAIRERWWSAGTRCVVITYGAYHGMNATQFKRLCPYGAYAGNDMGGNFMPWQPLGEVEPCRGVLPPAVGGDMEKIGNQHGITGFVDWLQKQPDAPARGPKYDPANHSTWPWPEKLERTLNLMREDHDARADA